MILRSSPMSAAATGVPALSDVKPVRAGVKVSNWAYSEAGTRDLRIDFLRGLAVLSLIVNHIEIFSIFNLATWERVGVVSGAEGFVILAGVVLGSLHRKRITENGWGSSAKALIDRALQLYRVDLFVIISVGLLSFLPFIDARGAMSFTDRGAGATYPLYPTPGTSWYEILARIVLLQAGPHQVQILGLYTVLLFIAPLVLWAFGKNRVKLVLAISWILYLKNWAFPSMPTGMQFEYGFPTLTWQLIFFHGLAFGYYRNEIAAWFKPRYRTLALAVSYVLCLGFMFFSLNNPYPSLPPWARISYIAPAKFTWWYTNYFLKNTLGILRLVNYLAVLVVAYHLLTLCWTPIKKALGWFFLPFGQASLYVFILHVYVLLLIYNLPLFKGLVPDYRSGNLWINTVGHACALMILWLLVRFQVAYKWVPR